MEMPCLKKLKQLIKQSKELAAAPAHEPLTHAGCAVQCEAVHEIIDVD